MFPFQVPTFEIKPKKMFWAKVSTDMLLFLWTILLCERTLMPCSAMEESTFDIDISNWTRLLFAKNWPNILQLSELTNVNEKLEDHKFKNYDQIIPKYIYSIKNALENNSPNIKNNSEPHLHKQPKNIEIINSDFVRKLVSDILIRTSKKLIEVSKEMKNNLKSVSNKDSMLRHNDTLEDNNLKTDYSNTNISLTRVILDAVDNNADTVEVKDNVCKNSSCVLDENSNSVNFDATNTESNSKLSINESISDKHVSNDVITESKIRPKETSRQFVFHPYLPHEKDIPPDEKISFSDILPVKMVKFVKQMVEEAPWEQMFMKMVRMIVDQFVDKIIEKMFAHKEDDDKGRSMDVVLTPSWILPTYATPVVRLRRAVAEHSKEVQPDEFASPLPRMKIINEITKKKKRMEEPSWLDQFLDYVFPDTKSSPAEEKANYRIEKRETDVANRNKLLRKIILFFVETYEKFSDLPFNSNPDDKFQDSVRYRVLKEVLPALFETKNQTYSDDNSDMHNSIFLSSDTLPANLARRDLNKESLKIASGVSHRTKRSLGFRSNRMEDEERLWQASRRSKPPSHHLRRDECSLRQACNAGRLLSRLPSIHEITLQLRSYHNEPHWDAFLWGIKKKKCTKIYCKRHRSPKGSKYHNWDSKEDTISRRHNHSKIASHSEEESTEAPVSS